MPKDEFDFDDPMEINGVGLACAEDTSEAMTECFVEEFMRLGYNHKQILALFRNPHYLGMNMALQNRGEPFVRDTITKVFSCWGRPAVWPTESNSAAAPQPSASPGPSAGISETQAQPGEPDTGPIDPMGAPIPKLDL